MPRQAFILGLTAASFAWLVLITVLAHRFSVPSADGILYSLPFAAARHPFDLGVPFLNNFEGYGSSWGHHWPGTMWLRGLIFALVPYSRTTDVAILSCFQLLAAATAASLIWRNSGRMIPSLAAAVILLSDRLLLLACAGNRIEAPAVAALLILFGSTLRFRKPGSRCWKWIGPAAAFFCASGHPYTMVLGALILGLDLLSVRREGNAAIQQWIWNAAAFTLGCGSTAAWFLADHAAWNQFVTNLDLQKSFYRSFNSVREGLTNYRLHAGTLLWCGGLLAGLFSTWRIVRTSRTGECSGPDQIMFRATVVLLAVLVLHSVTRCENFHYLAFGAPFATILTCMFLSRFQEAAPTRLAWVPAVLLALFTLPHAALLPHRVVQFYKASCPNLHASYVNILRSVPEGRTIYISHALWPAAITDHTHTIRWFTFPIASRRATRESYEKFAYSDARPGDILILDRDSMGQPDRFGVFPTFNTNPPDPAKWKHLRDHVQILPGSIRWGLNLSLYEHLP